MVSKLSGINPTIQNQTNTTATQTQQADTSKSIFDQGGAKTKTKHGKGLGSGGIPPGIQKKIDSGKVPPSLLDKFKQLSDAIKAKEEAAKTEKTEAAPVTDPATTATPATTAAPVVANNPTTAVIAALQGMLQQIQAVMAQNGQATAAPIAAIPPASITYVA